MTHRDELLALKARVDALEQDLDETKAENELLRAAHARKTREVEALKRREEEDEIAATESPPPPPVTQTSRSSHRLVMFGFALLGLLSIAPFLAAHPGPGRGPMATAGGRVTPLLRVGTVTESSGPSLPAVGDRCTVERIPVAAGAFDCRVEVRCGGQTLYGDDLRAGFVQCGGQELVRDPNPTAFDGDPAMTLDLAHGVVVLEDRAGLSPQRVRIEL